jgi:hypothetical protein
VAFEQRFVAKLEEAFGVVSKLAQAPTNASG